MSENDVDDGKDKRRVDDIPVSEVREVCQRFRNHGITHINAKRLAAELDTSEKVVGTAIHHRDEWPLEDTGFSTSGKTYRITVDENGGENA